MTAASIAVRERPIPFSGPMVCAILDDTKTQTRRVVKGEWADSLTREDVANEARRLQASCECPYGQPGDRLWVREAWRLGANLDALSWSKIAPGRLGRIEYPATPDTIPWANRGRLRHARFMPRRLSRITLEIASVRVQRLQELSHPDAVAEGMSPAFMRSLNFDGASTPRAPFCVLWNSLNEKRGYGWAVNPWVWVLEFRKVEP